eukprot:5963554-Prymnesium_polylepis.1
MTARRLGLFLGQTQPQAQTELPADAVDTAAAPASSGSADASSAAASAMPRRARRRSVRRAQLAAQADAQPHTPSLATAAVGDAAAPQARDPRPVEVRMDEVGDRICTVVPA